MWKYDKEKARVTSTPSQQDVLNEFIKKATSPDCDLISVSIDTGYASGIQEYCFKIANHE